MKTTALRTWTAVCVSVLTATAAVRAAADQTTTAAKPEKTYTGMVKSIDPKEHVVNVDGTLLSKKFNLGDACTYTFTGKGAGIITDLHPGQKVTVAYRNADGILVAHRIQQQPMQYEGTIKAIDPAKHTVIVHVSSGNKTFLIGYDCKIALRNNKSGTLADVQPGHRVTVTYETPGETPVARQIAQTSASFTGTVTAVDTTDRTVKAKSLLGSKKFNLGDGCKILVNGKPEAEVRDLKPGDKLVFNYDEVNGVNVASRIANAEGSAEVMTATGK